MTVPLAWILLIRKKTSCSGLPSMSATGTATNSIQSGSPSAWSSVPPGPGQQQRVGWCWQRLHGAVQVALRGGAWHGTQHCPALPVSQGYLHPPAGS